MSRAATILIVEPEDRDRRLLELMLQPEGYITITATDGRTALAAVAEQSIDLVLLSITMPGMDGCEVASILKASSLTKSVPIIMVTTTVDRETRLAALATGVEEFLAKPIDRAELCLRVRNLLRLKEYGDFLAGYNSVLEQRVTERTAELQRFRMAMDSTVDAIFLTSRTTMKFVEVNATASVLLGYTRDELLGLAPAELVATGGEDLKKTFDAVIEGTTTGSLVKTRARRKDGSDFAVERHRYARRSGDDWILVDVLHDITERVLADERLLHLAHHDALTGLRNRTLFYDTLKKTLSLAARKHSQVAIMFLDVDHFKDVNDTLGHVIGDQVLARIADVLVGCVRLRDTVGRLGGDEFALILPMQHELAQA